MASITNGAQGGVVMQGHVALFIFINVVISCKRCKIVTVSTDH